MKTAFLRTTRNLALAGVLSLCIPRVGLFAQEPQDALETDYPNLIHVELGAREFAPGDGIVITSLRGNRRHLEPGGSYVLEGSYTLSSAARANLAWFATSPSPAAGQPVTREEDVEVARGSGRFRLKKTLKSPGWLHVSFYVKGRPHGGIYFGEKGFEGTVLRKKDWSDFAAGSVAEKSAARLVSEPANLAILAYLGHPVPAPPHLDSKYDPTNLRTTFFDLGKQADWEVRSLRVDDSEFPYLLYGVLGGKHDFREIQDALRKIKDYTYAGSVVGTTGKGSTYFSLNIIPYEVYPARQAGTCDRRLMVRLQMLADRARQGE